MDYYNDDGMAIGKMLALLSPKRLAVGAKQLRKALHSGAAEQVLLARNADPAITEPLAALSKKYGVRVHWVSSMRELGNACGIEVGASAAAVMKD